MPSFNIQLFGKFSIQHNGQELERFDARKVQELFCYLLLHREYALPREKLASILWPDTTTIQSKKNLRQALWQLQSVLGAQAQSTAERLVLVEPDWVHLNPKGDYWFDVAVFENAFELVQKALGQTLDVASAQTLQDAVQLYQGPLLEGCYQDWCLVERERLQNMYLTMLDKLMIFCEVHQDYETGLLYGTRIMCYDRARERTHRQLMRLYYLLGDRTEALRQYERCAVAQEEELGTLPSRSTQKLYKQIQADTLDEPALASPELDTVIKIADPSVSELIEHLTYLHQSLEKLQDQVKKSMHKVELVLHNHS